MLTHIDVRDLVAIQSLQLPLASGTTAITGETGTGKSILIDAIGLALGGRASGHPVRPGADRADITLTFDVAHLPAAIEWLSQQDLEQDNNECIIRRILTPDGRTRSYVNGTPLPLSKLRELAEKLIHIHGQHAQHSLVQPKAQLQLLDSYAGSLLLAEKVSVCALAFRTLQTEIRALTAEIEKERAQAEFLQFQLSELQTLHLTCDEFQTLDQLQRQLGHADTTLSKLNESLELLNGQDPCISSLLRQLTRLNSSLQPICPEATLWQQTLLNITVQLNDLEESQRHTAEKSHQDPEKLAAVEKRLSLLFDMARKHRIQPEQLFAFQQQLATRLQEHLHGDIRLAALIAEADQIKKQYLDAATALSAKRQIAVNKLCGELRTMFRQLALSHANFSIILEPTTDTLPAAGLEQPVFYISTSPDQPPQPLASVASGGELSRISLAIHIASAREHATPTLIFDEVDTGIGGGTTETIGRLLRQLGDSRQVFCVTHTPQVAAQAHHHVRVQKQLTHESASICIESLTSEERVNEIARMLGGIEITRKTLAHAQEMTEKAQIADAASAP